MLVWAITVTITGLMALSLLIEMWWRSRRFSSFEHWIQFNVRHGEYDRIDVDDELDSKRDLG
jgi:hypothetical protein